MTDAAKLALALSVATVAAVAAATPAGAVDFDCRVAMEPAERTICADARLARLDETMARTYGRLWSLSGTRERLQLRDAQLRFLAARNGCRWNARCIGDAYLDQIGVLDDRLAEAGGR